METLIVILVVLLLIGALPTWPYSRTWGYAPSGLITTLLVVLLLFWVL